MMKYETLKQALQQDEVLTDKTFKQQNDLDDHVASFCQLESEGDQTQLNRPQFEKSPSSSKEFETNNKG